VLGALLGAWAPGDGKRRFVLFSVTCWIPAILHDEAILRRILFDFNGLAGAQTNAAWATNECETCGLCPSS
jgi:hypothetical protein